MTDIAAAIGIEQLKKLTKFNERRRENAVYFDKNLFNIDDIETPFVLGNVEHVYHQYTLICKYREKIINDLIKKKIGYGIYYPKPLHFYKHLKIYASNYLKNSESLSNKVLSLPVHPDVSKENLKLIVDTIVNAFT